jgi:hypothetical protein
MVSGMYELKDAYSYMPFDTTLNTDSNTWKHYDSEIRENGFKLKEIVFDLRDAVIQGTSDSNQYMDQVFTRFQLRFNKTLAQVNAYKSCGNNKF